MRIISIIGIIFNLALFYFYWNIELPEMSQQELLDNKLGPSISILFFISTLAIVFGLIISIYGLRYSKRTHIKRTK